MNTVLTEDSQLPYMITVRAISELVVPLHRISLLSAVCHSKRVEVNNTNFVILYVLVDVGGNTTNASYFQVLHPG